MAAKKNPNGTRPRNVTSPEPQIALLRGVNVGGKNRIAMKDLAAMFEAAGCTDVRTYIQSGNVVFTVSAARAGTVRPAAERALSARLGNAITVVLRTRAEWIAAIKANPYLAPDADLKQIHVAFMSEKPSSAQIAALDPNRSKPDEFSVHGREIYLRFPAGLGQSKLTNDYFDRTLKTVVTVRNWNTVLALREMATELSKPKQ